MTRVVYRKKGGHYFECTGHANYGDAGKDIVCASVSTLCCTLCNVLMDKGIEPVAYEQGAVVIRTESQDSEVDVIFCTIMTGFYQLSEQYGEFVQVL